MRLMWTSTWLAVKVGEGIPSLQLHEENANENFIVISVSSSASVVEQLEFGDFFSESITKRCLFASVHDAVLYCLNHRGATSLPRYGPSVVSVLFFCFFFGPTLISESTVVSCSVTVSTL